MRVSSSLPSSLSSSLRFFLCCRRRWCVRLVGWSVSTGPQRPPMARADLFGNGSGRGRGKGSSTALEIVSTMSVVELEVTEGIAKAEAEIFRLKVTAAAAAVAAESLC